MELSEFNYYLPEELIAQTPIAKRDESRLMVLDKKTGEIKHKIFRDIIEYLEPGDCLVIAGHHQRESRCCVVRREEQRESFI